MTSRSDQTAALGRSRTRTNRRRIGAQEERIAAAFLMQHGVRITDRNFRDGRAGEIDLIGYDGSVLVFVEVKYRASSGSGTPEEAVTLAKQQAVCRTARFYLAQRRIPPDRPIRFDVIAIRPAEQVTAAEAGAAPDRKRQVYIRWLRNAFEYRL